MLLSGTDRDYQVLKELFLEHYEKLLLFANASLRKTSQSEDAVHELFLVRKRTKAQFCQARTLLDGS